MASITMPSVRQSRCRPAENPYEQAHGGEQDNVNHVFKNKCDRADYSGQAQNQKDIENIGANYISQRHIQLFLPCSHNRGDQFGQAGADGDDGQPDQVLAQAQAAATVVAPSTTKSPPNLMATRPPAINRIHSHSGRGRISCAMAASSAATDVPPSRRGPSMRCVP